MKIACGTASGALGHIQQEPEKGCNRSESQRQGEPDSLL